MSKEFKDRLARGELTNTKDYRRIKEALGSEKKDQSADVSADSQEWKNWALSPEWSASNSDKNNLSKEVIRADSVQRALDRMDKL